ncbi:hypothetical protein G4B88_020178 [Cannabis sativa]|uniref:Uncharacterized protein n=1 Tax=Cannabis sativa TaxID=3483 RepID=A0A7J6E527_CANSA|nr:hypothetical protein G4B88_020178 [Cannabis sativa]
MKLIGVLLLISMCLSPCFLQLTMANDLSPSPTPAPMCEVRCGKARRKDRCLKYCGICCKACKCVPSGTYGNKSECPYYRDKLSSKGTPKCP